MYVQTLWKHPLTHVLISTLNCVKRILQTKITRTALQFASVAINTDPVPKPGELTVAQKYAILAEQVSNSQKIKSWVKLSVFFNQFEDNNWNTCPISAAHLRQWTMKIKNNGCLSVKGRSVNTPECFEFFNQY